MSIIREILEDITEGVEGIAHAAIAVGVASVVLYVTVPFMSALYQSAKKKYNESSTIDPLKE